MRDFSLPHRSCAVAENGMAATSHPMATLVALDVLRHGGNAVDAALAAAAMLAVVEPAMTGIGGDCFVLYAPEAKAPVALNGSGRAPAAAEVGWYRARGMREIAPTSPHAVTIPGAVDAWCRLHADYATKELAELFAPAIRAAEDGYPVTPRVAWDWETNAAKLAGDPHTAALFLPGGRPPAVGDRHRQPQLAATLGTIALKGRAGFYEGTVMADMLARLSELGGLHDAEDFAACRAEYVTPISAPFRGHTVVECPPNGQGLAALMMLRILDGYELESLDLVDRIHLLAEATKVSLAMRDAVIADPETTPAAAAQVLAEPAIARIRAGIARERAGPAVRWAMPEHADTTYLAVVDRDRNAISFINSLFHAFGSAILAPKSGVLLQCRGVGFRIEEGHPNAIGPRKRPMHTIIPGLVMKDDRVVMPFGVMGGHYQPTGHAHLLTEILALGGDPQQAAEAPRSFAVDGVLRLETTIPNEVAEALKRRGHDVVRAAAPFGGAQAIQIDHARGILVGGCEPRRDSLALGY